MAGERAAETSAPDPAWAIPALSRRAIVSRAPAVPQSTAWLLAVLTRSMPADVSPSMRAKRLRNVYSFHANLVPLSEMGPSRLTKARSAALR